MHLAVRLYQIRTAPIIARVSASPVGNTYSFPARGGIALPRIPSSKRFFLAGSGSGDCPVRHHALYREATGHGPRIAGAKAEACRSCQPKGRLTVTL